MIVDLGDISLRVQEDGSETGPPVVFANSLGTTHALWDQIIPLLPNGLRLIRYDMRGHGGSDVPTGPYSMGALIRDAERLLDHLQVRDCVFIGLSIGGMVAQGLATKRLDLVRGLVLSNTAAKMGTAQMWQDRIDAIQKDGLAGIADSVMERWFSKRFRMSPEVARWRQMLVDTPVDGYAGCCAAIAGTDFYTTTAGLTLPTLAIAGSEDGASPPDLVRETQELIKGSRFQLIRGAGHLPCVEQPEVYADALTEFLHSIGHVPA
ncbi:3-oxoadipate enol-lactonase [Litoreibacter roseus]|uniref:3-oxoadipate enol-lactonase n=1 Tax=Litoreibacter roseus TaxID=2601869 RepID=A0A6N6JAA5_9RHOB|nr:3-oxoadipate enol-lactonase [Litoreibacter roseus]